MNCKGPLSVPCQEHQPHAREPSGYRCYYNQEEAFQVTERPSRRQMQPRRPLEQGRSASAPNLHTESLREEATHSCDPPTYEETMQSLGRAPTQQDLGPFSPVSLSSLLVPYDDNSPSTPKGEEQQPAREERMEDQEEGTIAKKKTPQLNHKRQRKSMYLAPLSMCQPAMTKKKCSVMRIWRPHTWPPGKLIKPSQ